MEEVEAGSVRGAELENAGTTGRGGNRVARESGSGNGSLGLYLDEIGKFELLSAEEEVDLANRVKGGDEGAREVLINANLRLVVKIARDYATATGGSLEDLIQAGNIGLMEASGRFEPSFGTRFSTYAACWIKQKIRRSIESDRTVRLPAHVHEKMRAIAKARDEEVQRTGREASSGAVAVATGLPAEKVRMVEAAVQPLVSIDAPARGDEGGQSDGPAVADAVADERVGRADEVLAQREVVDQLHVLLPNLSDREQFVLASRFGLDGGDPMTLEQIGVASGISRERVRQLQNAALDKLKEMLTQFSALPVTPECEPSLAAAASAA